MGSVSAEVFSFGQLMIAGATGAVLAAVMMFVFVLVKHDDMRAKVRYAEDGHRQAQRLLALQASASGYLMDGRFGLAPPGRLAHHSLQGALRRPTRAMTHL